MGIMGIEGWVDSAGLTFFCNSMVEEIYRLKKTGEVSKKLAENCKQAIVEFKGFYWPKKGKEKSYLLDSKLFNNMVNLNTLERFLKDTKKTFNEQFIDGMIRDLEYIGGNNPAGQKSEIAANLQLFFDKLGDYAFYAGRDCLRGDSNDYCNVA